CPQMFNSSCQNFGYLDPRTCTTCVCPEGFGGQYCETIDPTSTCGGIITNPNPYLSTQITIQNPSPTSATRTTQYCVWMIRSLSAQKIHLRLDFLNTDNQETCNLTNLVEIKYRNDLALTGARMCGNSQRDSFSASFQNITATINTMMVIFRANNYLNNSGNPMYSFRATVTFDAEPLPLVNLTTTTLLSTPSPTTTPRVITPIPISTSTTTTTTTTLRVITPIPISTSTTTTFTSQATIATSNTCPSPSFRCQLATQPTCGGCLRYEPCLAQGTQQCIVSAYQAQLVSCNQIINGVAQCSYR
ncbi:unnamed protein product, partial [Didymodactylos carnosus]